MRSGSLPLIFFKGIAKIVKMNLKVANFLDIRTPSMSIKLIGTFILISWYKIKICIKDVGFGLIRAER